jgi:putative flavoprotein involved in K+ transport
MSRCLAERSIDHIVLERGEVANSWKKERWDSLRLLTPNWQSRLPGYGYEGDSPDSFRTMPETIAFLEKYARVIAAPVQTQTRVTAVRPRGEGYVVATTRGDFESRTVVLASGACNVPLVPAFAESMPRTLATLTAFTYRNASQIEKGGVLVVGASATGTQIAEEIQRAGHPVFLSVGEHVRVPRVYRGRDIKWWMDKAGVLDERYDQIDDIVRARNVPSLQLAGSPERQTLDLNTLTKIGVKLVGRLAGIQNGKAQFSGSLRNVCALSDLKMNRLLERIDQWTKENGLDAEVDPPHRFEPTKVDTSPPLVLDLPRLGIRTIVWATGFRPDFSWLEAPVFDHKGRILHDGGVVKAPGLYLMGMPFLRRRKSSLIDGAADDARDLCDHLVSYLGGLAGLGGVASTGRLQ